jgi:hypothetical protein
MRTFQAYRDNTTFMHFWDAINEGRAAAGQAEALYGNVRRAVEAGAPTDQR